MGDEFMSEGTASTATDGDLYKSDLEHISQTLYTLTKENLSIERRIKDFENMDPTDRFSLRESLQENTQLSNQLQKTLVEFDTKYLKVKGAAKKIKTAYKNSLQALKKECKKLETLGTQIVFKERELLGKCRPTQKFQTMNDPEPERRSLLESEQENYAVVSGGYEENKGETQKGNEAQDFIMKQQEELDLERHERIIEVCDSIENVPLQEHL